VRRSSASRRRLAGLIVMVAVTATACGDKPLTTMDAKGDKAELINGLAIWVFAIAGVVFVLVEGMILYASWRFRVKPPENPADERPGGYSDDEFPAQIHGHDALEWGWTALPALLLAIVAVFTVVTIFLQDDVEASGDEMVVEVVGQQWWWEFQYHLDGNTDTPPDIVTANEMVMPTGVDVPLFVQSRDVIHSFWIPALNGKRDAVPGRSQPWVLQANETGRFMGQCTEFCGLSHAYMRMFTVAVTPAEFDAWVADQTVDAAMLSEGELGYEGQQLFVAQCAECHIIEGVTDRDGDPSNGVDSTDIYVGRPGVDDRYTDSLTSGAAPNLTHLMSRETFAGSYFDLYDEDGNVNRAQLEAWVLNAPSQKPNRPDNLQGMRAFLNLTPEQLGQIVDYLETLQ
jgi:cytochrome c oxidase subunit II